MKKIFYKNKTLLSVVAVGFAFAMPVALAASCGSGDNTPTNTANNSNTGTNQSAVADKDSGNNANPANVVAPQYDFKAIKTAKLSEAEAITYLKTSTKPEMVALREAIISEIPNAKGKFDNQDIVAIFNHDAKVADFGDLLGINNLVKDVLLASIKQVWKVPAEVQLDFTKLLNVGELDTTKLLPFIERLSNVDDANTNPSASWSNLVYFASMLTDATPSSNFAYEGLRAFLVKPINSNASPFTDETIKKYNDYFGAPAPTGLGGVKMNLGVQSPVTTTPEKVEPTLSLEQVTALTQRISDLENLIKTIQTKMTALATEDVALNEKNANLQKQIDDLKKKAEPTTGTEQNTTPDQKILDLENLIKAIQTKNATLTAEDASLREKITLLQTQIDDLKKRVDAIVAKPTEPTTPTTPTTPSGKYSFASSKAAKLSEEAAITKIKTSTEQAATITRDAIMAKAKEAGSKFSAETTIDGVFGKNPQISDFGSNFGISNILIDVMLSSLKKVWQIPATATIDLNKLISVGGVSLFSLLPFLERIKNFDNKGTDPASSWASVLYFAEFIADKTVDGKYNYEAMRAFFTAPINGSDSPFTDDTIRKFNDFFGTPTPNGLGGLKIDLAIKGEQPVVVTDPYLSEIQAKTEDEARTFIVDSEDFLAVAIRKGVIENNGQYWVPSKGTEKEIALKNTTEALPKSAIASAAFSVKATTNFIYVYTLEAIVTKVFGLTPEQSKDGKVLLALQTVLGKKNSKELGIAFGKLLNAYDSTRTSAIESWSELVFFGQLMTLSKNDYGAFNKYFVSATAEKVALFSPAQLEALKTKMADLKV